MAEDSDPDRPGVDVEERDVDTAAGDELPAPEAVVPRGASGGVARPRGRARAAQVTRRVRRVLRSRGDILAVIAAGGALGSLARWGLTLLLPHPAGSFPWATFTANVVGCLLLGALMVAVLEVLPPSRYLRPFLGVGILGGFTTFSTYMLDARALLVAGHTALAGQYVFGSLAAGLGAVWVGATTVRLLMRGRRRHATGRPGVGSPRHRVRRDVPHSGNPARSVSASTTRSTP